MRTLVTGAAGFLGSHVTDLLVAGGERPRVLIRPGDRLWPGAANDLEVHRADISNPIAVRTAVDGVQRIIHCAARTGPWGPDTEYDRTNVRAVETLVRCALDAGVTRVVHVSSITVHGNDVRGEADETCPFRDEPNPYSRSKAAAERLLERLIAEDGAPVTIVRPGWIYGPRDSSSFARIARMIETGRMLMIGSGENHVPLVYVGDVAQGILLASEAECAVGKSYLLVNDEPVTQREFLTAIATELGVPAPTRRIPYELALGVGTIAEKLARFARRTQPPPVMRYGLQLLGGENRFNITRGRRELGFAPLVDLAEGVSRGVMWYRGGLQAPSAPKVTA